MSLLGLMYLPWALCKWRKQCEYRAQFEPSVEWSSSAEWFCLSVWHAWCTLRCYLTPTAHALHALHSKSSPSPLHCLFMNNFLFLAENHWGVFQKICPFKLFPLKNNNQALTWERDYFCCDFESPPPPLNRLFQLCSSKFERFCGSPPPFHSTDCFS